MARIYIVGAGPGRADLLTVRAARILAHADAVLYDRLVSDEVLQLVSNGAELVPVGKEEGRQEEIQTQILDLLEDCARRHSTIVRLKGGDPFVFGRGAEEWAYLLERGWDVDVVPGISSAIAVPSAAGVPPTFRGIATGFAVVTGHAKDGFPEHWARYKDVETLIILMGVKHRVEIAQTLIEAGRRSSEPVCFIENGTTPRERVVEATLGAVANGQVRIEAPAVFVIGEVVRMRERLLGLVRDAVA